MTKRERLRELADLLETRQIEVEGVFSISAEEIEEVMAELLPPDDVYMVPVSKDLYEQQRAEGWSKPVRVRFGDLREDGTFDMIFKRGVTSGDVKLFRLEGYLSWGSEVPDVYVVRARDEEHARQLVSGLDGGGWHSPVDVAKMDVTELTVNGDGGYGVIT